MRRLGQKQYLLWAALAVAIVGYVMPWVLNKGSGLTLGAYDLALWTNLHPATRPDLTPALLLRGQLLIFMWLVAFGTLRPLFTRAWMLRLVVVLVLFAAQLPPLEFLQNTGDINQRQQAILAMVSLGISVIGLSGIVSWWRVYVMIVLGITGIATSLYALNEGIALMQTYGLPAYRGGGSIVLLVAYALLIIYSVASGIAQRNPTQSA